MNLQSLSCLFVISINTNCSLFVQNIKKEKQNSRCRLRIEGKGTGTLSETDQ